MNLTTSRHCAWISSGLAVALVACWAGRSARGEAVDYNRDIRPILSNNCYACHGPDAAQRKAGLRLDIKDNALGELESGEFAIVPGKLDESALIERITASDDDMKMPPKDCGKELTAKQVDLLKKWVAEGAPWKSHWSFIAPERPAPPAVRTSGWPRNDIDRFVLARLERDGLSPSPEADRVTLIRRVTLDLTGLPPTPAEVDAFVLDNRQDAYERLVDRLLASPHYGERMAVEWLDAARYADTHGYHIDSGRSMWRWRDWVINAFNGNVPFDRFTVEQLAGDLLPGATESQKMASGFNRNHMINFEGGAIPEEYLAAYLMDRVKTTSTVWMGLTMGCAQCHDHKYDPFTQKDFYRLYAFFNHVPENGLDGQKGNAAPFISTPTKEQKLDLAAKRGVVNELEARLAARASDQAGALAEWEKRAPVELASSRRQPAGLFAHYDLDEAEGTTVNEHTGKRTPGTISGIGIHTAGKINGALRFDGSYYVDLGHVYSPNRENAFSYGAWVNPAKNGEMAVIARLADQGDFQGWDLYLFNGRVTVDLIHHWPTNAIRVRTKRAIEPGKWRHLFTTYDGSSKAAGVKIYIDGHAVETETTHDTLTGSILTGHPVQIGRRRYTSDFHGLIDDVRIYDRVLSRSEVEAVMTYDPVPELLEIPAAKRTAQQQEAVRKYYFEHFDKEYQRLAKELTDARDRLTMLEKQIPTTMVMQEMAKPRDTFLLMRGQYDHPGEKVTPTLPEALPPLPAGAPANRLGLAEWLISPSHPLTSRVIVNRFWQMYFGAGIVKTAEDFGSQGEWPSHPELLDWLATEFIRIGWDVKAMQKLIVTSAAYRQSSAADARLVARDPENRLLARGPRLRLHAEFIRDQALAACGLLNAELGGPSVYPYQPAGIWEEMAFGEDYSAQKYGKSTGKDLYRRGMYTFWKRTVPPASLSTFDAPDREVCTVRRSRTNTPLQALVLLNDPTYIEAARVISERLLRTPDSSDEQRIAQAYRLILARAPQSSETAELQNLLKEQFARYRASQTQARQLISVGESKADPKLDAAELAAWTVVVSTILNLDETITRG